MQLSLIDDTWHTHTHKIHTTHIHICTVFVLLHSFYSESSQQSLWLKPHIVNEFYNSFILLFVMHFGNCPWIMRPQLNLDMSPHSDQWCCDAWWVVSFLLSSLHSSTFLFTGWQGRIKKSCTLTLIESCQIQTRRSTLGSDCSTK